MSSSRSSRHSALVWGAVALITLGAAVLRLWHIGGIESDPFYDAAVRSMGLSWHNFFFGAYDPSAATSIDKPPVDLWLQVASVELLGFNRTTVKLPEALAGIAAVPLLFAAVRRMWSTAAGLAAAVGLAVLPVEVITSRSDTMDGLMMALIVLALWLIVRACETGRYAWLLAGAAALGVAFDVKLLESLVALPGLALLAFFGMPGTPGRRLVRLAGAGALYVAVALAWLTATLLVPAHERPYAIGSTDGSAWNAAFVFNGTDRLGGKSPEPQQTVYRPGYHYPVATQAERDHIPIVPPSTTRLLARIGPLSGERLGLELLIALLLGVPALIAGVLADRRAAARAGRGDEAAFAEPGPPPDSPGSAAGSQTALPHVGSGPRLRRATAACLIVWTLTGIVLFSEMIRLHPRYVEGFLPAVAALLGIGVAWACSIGAGPRGREPRDRAAAREDDVRLIALAVALVTAVAYVELLEYGLTGAWWASLAAAAGALALAVFARLRPASSGADEPGAGEPGVDAPAGNAGRPGSSRAALLTGATIALTLTAILVLPLRADVSAIENDVSDAGYVGALPREQLEDVSAYVRAHRRGVRYELAAESATEVGALIVADREPIVILTTYDARVLTSVPQLRRLIADGEVRYAFLNTFCGAGATYYSNNAACSAPVRWIRAHGTDVSRAAGLRRAGLLYLLPGAKP
jgi:4-amino-4-deoxy-L-arabinose transferase-like glycosyltransferase